MIYLYRFLQRQLQRTRRGKALLGFVARHQRQVDTVESFLIALLLAVVIVTFIVEAFQIPTGSMNDTLLEGDRVFVNKFLYPLNLLDIRRGDIIVFRTRHIPAIVKRAKETGEKQPFYIKRVVALGGDTVSVHHGRIHINGEPLDSRPVFRDNSYFRYIWTSATPLFWPEPGPRRWPGGGAVVADRRNRQLVLVDDHNQPVGVFRQEAVIARELLLSHGIASAININLRRLRAAVLGGDAAGHRRVTRPARIVAADNPDETLYRLEWAYLPAGNKELVHLDRILDGDGNVVCTFDHKLQRKGKSFALTSFISDRNGTHLYARHATQLLPQPGGRYPGGAYPNTDNFVVPDDHVMVMGDNSLNSLDGRDWGTVPVDDVVGRAFFRFWPLHRLGFIPSDPPQTGEVFRPYLEREGEEAFHLLPPDPWAATSQLNTATP